MRLLAGLLLVAVVLSGCRTGDDDVAGGGGDGDATAALEGQRDEVRQAAAELVTGAVAALGGTSSNTRGGFEGCESTFNDQYRTFQYRANGRVDAGEGAARPFLDALASVLTGAGFGEPVTGERPGGQTLSAERGDLSATFSELPGQGDYVLLTVEGPCVEVPEDDRDDWLVRQDPAPYL